MERWFNDRDICVSKADVAPPAGLPKDTFLRAVIGMCGIAARAFRKWKLYHHETSLDRVKFRRRDYAKKVEGPYQ